MGKKILCLTQIIAVFYSLFGSLCFAEEFDYRILNRNTIEFKTGGQTFTYSGAGVWSALQVKGPEDEITRLRRSAPFGSIPPVEIFAASPHAHNDSRGPGL
jgi:hypothetical protein